MNLDYFGEAMELMCGQSTQRPTKEEQLILENSLLLIKKEYELCHMFYWGRITGVENDYFIGFGVHRDMLGERQFFYSTNCHEWIMLPQPEKELENPSLLCTTKFLGDPSFITTVQLDPKFSFDENQIILATEPELFRLKEEDRLAWIVHQITDEAAIVPRGALYKMLDHTIIHHELFHGLGELEINDMSFYFHYRQPRNDYLENLSKKPDYNYCIDFMDPIDETFPKKLAFSLIMENEDRLVVIKSLLWLGMVFIHKLNSKKHAFMYDGDGKFNRDLLFML